MRRLGFASAILAIATALLLAAGTAAATPTSAPASADAQRATAALDYLLAAQAPDGSIDASIGETADFVIGTADAGYDPATLTGCGGGTSALDFLATASDAAASDAAKTGKAVLAVVAAGASPSSFHGRDLLARLDALYHPATGAYGDGSTFAQSLAILAMAASGRYVSQAAVAELRGLRDSDGSWSYGTAPVAPGGGDSNSTSIALMALDRVGDHSLDSAALKYLKTQQMPDGGFAYQNPSPYGPAASDPDSDSIVIQALLGAGQDPEAAEWAVGSSNAVTHLREAQEADGGYSYPGAGETALTTAQVPATLTRHNYGAVAKFTTGAGLPGSRCAAPRPSSSAVQGSSVGPSLTATVSPTPTSTASPTIGAAGDSTAGGPPASLWLVLVVGLAVAVAGGWFALSRSRKR
jgi:hypothetical protein